MKLLNALSRLFAPRASAAARALYGAIVRQARQPVFYTRYGVPDTLDGRFDMIVLFAALVMRALRRHPHGNDLAQEVFDLMFLDMDRSLREMGAGDLSVPKRVRAMAEAFYGRATAYDRALDAPGDDPLRDALARNVYAPADGEARAEDDASALARHARAADKALSAQSFDELQAGIVRFPAPEA